MMTPSRFAVSRLMSISTLLSVLGAVASPLSAQWEPVGELAGVPVSEDCERTAQAPARAAEGPQIFTCTSALAAVDAEVEGASVFFLVHEYGHIAIEDANESQADCWAARELGASTNGTVYIDAIATWLEARAGTPAEPFGSHVERALRIRECSGLPFAPPAMGDTCCTEIDSCPLPGSGATLLVGAGCYCSAPDGETGFSTGRVCVHEGNAQPAS